MLSLFVSLVRSLTLSLFVLLLARVRSLNCEMLTGIHSLKVHARICACACAYWYTMRPHHDSYSACSQHCQLSACYAGGVAKYRSPAVRHLGCTVRADACKYKHNRKPRSPCPALPHVPRALLSVRPALLRVANVPRALLCLCSWASSGPENRTRCGGLLAALSSPSLLLSLSLSLLLPSPFFLGPGRGPRPSRELPGSFRELCHDHEPSL